MKLSRCLLGGVLLAALSGLAFAAEPSAVVVDKSMNVEIVALQSLQVSESVDFSALEVVSHELSGESVIALTTYDGAVVALAVESERMCGIAGDKAMSNKSNALSATAGPTNNGSEVKRLVGNFAQS